MKKQPIISIITISYNSESTIEEAIKSVVTQNYPFLEYIIIDGGSKDGTIGIIEKYRHKISGFVSEKDNGISNAFNKGINMATGDVIGIINSDDILLPNALLEVANSYSEDVGVYRGNTVIWNPDTDVKVTAKPTMKFSPYALKQPSVCHQSTFVLKKIYLQYGLFDESLKYMMDVDLLMRLYKSEVVFKYIPCDLAVFRLGGVTSNSYKSKLSELKMMYLNNGANVLWVYFKLLGFILYNVMLQLASKLINLDKLRSIKYNRVHSK